MPNLNISEYDLIAFECILIIVCINNTCNLNVSLQRGEGGRFGVKNMNKEKKHYTNCELLALVNCHLGAVHLGDS